MFGQTIPLILFHFILFQTIQLFNPINHFIPFHFFSTLFFNFPNPYTISLILNYLYHLKIHKVKQFNIIFFQIIPNYFQTILTIPKNRKKNGQNSLPKHKLRHSLELFFFFSKSTFLIKQFDTLKNFSKK